MRRTYVWDLAITDPAHSRFTVLSHPKCTTAVRQKAVSPDGATIVCVCDDATVWRWDRVWVEMVAGGAVIGVVCEWVALAWRW